MALTERSTTATGALVASARPPELADGIELIGEYEGSGFKEPPSLVRRMDGQIIQLPPLLYRVAANADGRRSYDEIAASVSSEIQRGLDAEQVRFLVDEKLRPLGILAAADGSSPHLEKPDPFLALRFRAAVIPEQLSNRLGSIFKPLFLPVVVLAVLGAFVVADVWLFLVHGVAQALRQSIYHPGLFLPLFGAVVLAAAFHEIGHAAACRYGGGRPGKMGCGIYLAWPAFYTDVTDAYRLGRRARLRTDLGGVYFNVVVVLTTVGLYFATGFEPLLLLVVIQHLEIAHQLLPVVRLDGYYIVSDLTGVPDLFARIGPILRSVLPWHESDERVTALKRWVRVAVTAWVCIVVPLLVFELLVVLIHLPRIIGTAWDSSGQLLSATSSAFGAGQVASGLTSLLQVVVLLIPVLGIVLMLGKAISGTVRWTWAHTENRPVRRGLALALGATAAVALAVSWLPAHNYEPIQPGERGTLAEGTLAVGRLPRGDAPLYSEERAGVSASTSTSSNPSPSSGSVSGASDPAGSLVTGNQASSTASSSQTTGSIIDRSSDVASSSSIETTTAPTATSAPATTSTTSTTLASASSTTN